MSKQIHTLKDWLSAESFTMAMSSGFFGFYAHAGCLLALEEADLTPQRYTGASAGSLAAGFAASGLDSVTMIDYLMSVDRAGFWDPKMGLGLLHGGKFQSLLREMLPVERIEECPIPLAISVFDIATRKTVVLESGDLASAIHASCAVPGMFHPVKVNGRYYYDGGILDKDGVDGIAKHERTLFNHLMSRTLFRRYLMNTEKLPLRANLKALVVEGLPKVSPVNMQTGRQALAMSKAATKVALGLPAERAVFRVQGM